MKILIVGSSDVWAIENYFFRYLSSFENNHVEQLSTSSINSNLHVFQKIERRLFPNINSLYYSFNRRLLAHVYKHKPDVVFIFKGMEIFPKTLVSLRKQKLLLANFNGDHPFNIYSRGTGNKNVINSVALYDVHFSYIKSVVEQLRENYNLASVHLPFGYELDDDLYSRIVNVEEIPRIAFIGNPDTIRLNYIKHLLNANLPVDVYGFGWNNILNNTLGDLQIFEPVFGEDFWRIARKYRVQLNIFRPHNVGSHNMRTFEMPAVGAIMLAPDNEEHRMFFEPGHEVFLYNSIDEMILKAQYLLSISTIDANLIRENARNRSLGSGYSYRDRSKTVYHTFKKMIS